MDAMTISNTILQEMIDHYEITKLIATYCHGCDRGDGPRMASTYAMESRDNHGLYDGDGREFAAHVMKNTVAHNTSCFHTLGQSLIKVDGDKAGSDTYFIANVKEKNAAGEEVVNLMGGRYVDRLIREDGGWKVKDRVCVREWSVTIDGNKDWQRDMNFVPGMLSGEDPSYAVLGLKHPGLPKA